MFHELKNKRLSCCFKYFHFRHWQWQWAHFSCSAVTWNVCMLADWAISLYWSSMWLILSMNLSSCVTLMIFYYQLLKPVFIPGGFFLHFFLDKNCVSVQKTGARFYEMINNTKLEKDWIISLKARRSSDSWITKVKPPDRLGPLFSMTLNDGFFFFLSGYTTIREKLYLLRFIPYWELVYVYVYLLHLVLFYWVKLQIPGE